MKTPVKTTLAGRLVGARTARGMTQDAVAKAIGISQSSYSELEIGKSKSTTRIGSIARVLGVDAYWLETGEGEAEPSGVAETSPPYLPPDITRLHGWIATLSERQRKGLLQFIDG